MKSESNQGTASSMGVVNLAWANDIADSLYLTLEALAGCLESQENIFSKKESIQVVRVFMNWALGKEETTC
ncbi:hypothetical protein [Listeria booriae]|uniref:hypothetical protein n=1 Tax=Listeria booriae TaxID=1552123 RepID=UPI0016240D56|nr:hypothetical protein [Listeria booriae]MBC2149746.1 hypothetical protein [Listeria booriae]